MAVPPRPMWTPSSFADAVAEATAGIPEHHYLEFKQQYPYGDVNNEKMAGDIAALANDGGLLVVGVVEDKTTATSTRVKTIEVAGFLERVEQVARHRLDPPLNVEPWALPDPDDPTRGIVFVHVPASELAPHQAGGRYYGRNDRTTYKLSDAEVELYMRRRASRVERVTALLDNPIGYGHVRGNLPGRFAAVVTPSASRPELLAERLAPANFYTWLDEMFEAAAGLQKQLVADAAPMTQFVWQTWSPLGGHSWSHSRTPTVTGGPPGVARFTSARPGETGGTVVWFGVDESGTVSVAVDALVGPEPNVSPAPVVFEWPTMVATAAWSVAMCRAIHESLGVAMPLELGVRADGLSGAVPAVSAEGGTMAWMQRRTNRSLASSDVYRGQGHIAHGKLDATLQNGLHSAFGPLLRGTGVGDLLRPA